jgi:long-chain acyl-CoA synthetase
MNGQIGAHARGVAATAASDPERIALIDGSRRLTFGELDAVANGLAYEMADRGVGSGDAVGILLHNRAEWFMISHAVARLGAMYVPISPRLTQNEADYIVGDSGMKVCFTEGGARVSGDMVTTIDVDAPGFAVDATDPPRQDFLNTMPTLLGYTSGTTGRPKAVARPAPQPAPVATSSIVAAFWGYGHDTVQLICGPLYHTAPSAYAEYALWEGGCVVVQDRFSGDGCLSLIAEHAVSRTQMVPAHFVRILETDWSRYDTASIRLLIHAAAMCPVHLKWRILDVFPPGTVWELYGATEAMGTIISPGEWLLKPGSVGRPFPGLSVRVLDDAGQDAPLGQIGTIYVSQFPGARFSYRGDEEKTEAAYRDGFVTVGDLGHLDEHGYLYIADRRTDLIVSGGVNIYPAEVENALAADPDVVDSAVIGLADERMGHVVHAVIELRVGAARDADAILERLSVYLADFKRPRTIEFVDRLPREPNGKVLKRKLQEERMPAR